MTALRSTAAHASVAYLRIDGFAQQAVAEQARLKARLEESLGPALSFLKVHERIVIGAPDGAAVVVLANPRGALRFAWEIGADRALPLAVGLSHGPVRVSPGTPAALYGDALLTAEIIAKSVPAGAASASLDFRDALAANSPHSARRLSRGRPALDEQGRALATFRADRASCERSGRRFFAIAGAAAAAIVAIGIAVRVTGDPPPAKAARPVVAARVDAAPKPIIPARPATVTLDIRPEGEIYVNGTLKGKSPPLTKIQLPAGKHQLEIRSGKHKPMTTELVVAEGEELSVKHSFISAQPSKPFYKRWMDNVEKAIK